MCSRERFTRLGEKQKDQYPKVRQIEAQTWLLPTTQNPSPARLPTSLSVPPPLPLGRCPFRKGLPSSDVQPFPPFPSLRSSVGRGRKVRRAGGVGSSPLRTTGALCLLAMHNPFPVSPGGSSFPQTPEVPQGQAAPAGRPLPRPSLRLGAPALTRLCTVNHSVPAGGVNRRPPRSTQTHQSLP